MIRRMGLRLTRWLERAKERGISQAEIARRAGISPGYLTEIKKGDKDPSVDTTRRLAIVLGASIYDLLDDDALNEIGEIIRLAESMDDEGRAILKGMAKRFSSPSPNGEPPAK